MVDRVVGETQRAARVFLYYRTYWGQGTTMQWSGKNILARNKEELINVCMKSADLPRHDIHSYACVDRSTPQFSAWLRERFSEVFETNEGSDGNDFADGLPVYGGRGSSYKMFEFMEANRHRDDDIILVLEDDYLFVSGGFDEWVNACAHFDGFVSPFDHPDRYIRNDDSGGGATKVDVYNRRHWRTAESTTCTSGARYKFFRKTFFIRRLPRVHVSSLWPGRFIGRELPSIDRVFYRRIKWLHGIRLFTPIPGIASHLAKYAPPRRSRYLKPGCPIPSTQLSPGVDWEKRYAEVLRTVETSVARAAL